MGIFNNRVTSRLGLVLSVALLGALGPVTLHSSTGEAEGAQTYVLVTSDTVRTSQLVESVGGSVVTSASTMSTVGAKMTIEQAELVSRSALIQRIAEGSDVKAENQLAGGDVWWKYGK